LLGLLERAGLDVTSADGEAEKVSVGTLRVAEG
jgi:hypothetical protein